VAKPTDVEIFLRGCPESRIVAWLASVAGGATVAWKREGVTGYTTERGPVVLTFRMEDGPFDGVWIPWGRSLWATDLACARQAARALDCVVRCEPGADYPEADRSADLYVELQGGAERLGAWDDDPA
jgi:hypothetical protein